MSESLRSTMLACTESFTAGEPFRLGAIDAGNDKDEGCLDHLFCEQ